MKVHPDARLGSGDLHYQGHDRAPRPPPSKASLNQGTTWPQGDPGVPYGGDPRFSCARTPLARPERKSRTLEDTHNQTSEHGTHEKSGPTNQERKRGDIVGLENRGERIHSTQAKCRSWAPQQTAEGYEAVASSREGARSQRPDSPVVNHQFSQPQIQNHTKRTRAKKTHTHTKQNLSPKQSEMRTIFRSFSNRAAEAGVQGHRTRPRGPIGPRLPGLLSSFPSSFRRAR